MRIRAAANRDDERAVVDRLEALRAQHDIARYEITDDVVVDAECAIPHSHPVLTLNVAYEEDEDLLLGYLHEQLHWWGIENPRSQHPVEGEIYAWLRARHPEMTTVSEILHLHICWMEVVAGFEVLGRDRTVSTVLGRAYYQPIYRAVLDEWDELTERFERDGLGLPT